MNKSIVLFILLLSAGLICAEEKTQKVSIKNCQKHYDYAQYKQAFEACILVAKSGNPIAQTIVGEILDDGSAGKIDRLQALFWWNKAMEQNHTEAENLLALKYYYGGTIFERQKFWQQDYEKSLTIWTKSAYRGNSAAQFMVGEMQRLGQGTNVNLTEAYAWLNLALDGNYLLAKDPLHELLKILTKEEKKQATHLYTKYKNIIIGKSRKFIMKVGEDNDK